MTNKEKYLKDNVSVEEFIDELKNSNLCFMQYEGVEMISLIDFKIWLYEKIEKGGK